VPDAADRINKEVWRTFRLPLIHIERVPLHDRLTYPAWLTSSS
jgi:hypothetical protein